MFISKIIKPIYFFIFHLLTAWTAYRRKQRSIRAMAQLEPHLLEDIGFRREGDVYVPLDETDKSKCSVLVRNHRRKSRLRCYFLVRRRQRLKKDIRAQLDGG